MIVMVAPRPGKRATETGSQCGRSVMLLIIFMSSYLHLSHAHAPKPNLQGGPDLEFFGSHLFGCLEEAWHQLLTYGLFGGYVALGHCSFFISFFGSLLDPML